MANTLKLVGNSIELNRNLSSGDGGVLGPFTIQATQNGMSAAANFNLTVGGAAPTVGPIPLPFPYPLQPGFTPISSPSQITGSGNYQLTANVSDLNPIQVISGITIDGAGFTVGNSIVTAGQNVTIKNCNVNGNFTVNGSNTTITNNYAIGTSGINNNPSNVTFSHNLLNGIPLGEANVDDIILTRGGPPDAPSLSNLKFLYNIIQGTFDVGVEGIGGWTQCTFSGNYFTDVGWAIGGYWDNNRSPGGFTATYCTFQNNTVHSSGPYANHLFIFNTTADDDATANALWGGGGNSLVNNNTFSGNLRR